MNPIDTPTRFNKLLFFSALLGPPILSMLSAMLADHSDAPVFVGLLGSVLGGLICGMVLGRHVGKTSAGRVGLSFLFVILFVVVSFFMNFFGCAMGGFNMNIH
jgi:hypothetical protein